MKPGSEWWVALARRLAAARPPAPWPGRLPRLSPLGAMGGRFAGESPAHEPVLQKPGVTWEFGQAVG